MLVSNGPVAPIPLPRHLVRKPSPNTNRSLPNLSAPPMLQPAPDTSKPSANLMSPTLNSVSGNYPVVVTSTPTPNIMSHTARGVKLGKCERGLFMILPSGLIPHLNFDQPLSLKLGDKRVVVSSKDIEFDDGRYMLLLTYFYFFKS